MEVIDLGNGATCGIDNQGNKHWRLNGKLHRTDGPAIENVNGSKGWFLNGDFHRTDGPAVESADGDKYWYINDEYHRTDGPAIERANGTKYWFLHGTEYLEEDWQQAKEVLWAV